MDDFVPSLSGPTTARPSLRLKNKGEAGLAYLKMVKIGGDERDRTADLLVANETLSQLSYIPIPVIWPCAAIP